MPRLIKVIHAGVLIVLLGQDPATAQPPAAPPAVSSEALPVSLARIRRGLAAPAEAPLTNSVATFRLTIEARPIRLDVPWRDDSPAPFYVRTPRTLYHHEFLSMVTPEAFRSGALYPMGVNVLEAWPALRRAIRQAQEAKAREEVEAELREFERQQRAKRPPP
jgi:hypothetical protein